ncbi:MAG: tRNA (N(6)-L-threonylcarbamoyladenosine(37)-C(2))-methylthiotransferase MtaB [Chloroflexota bacterium]|nr:MAG: tRNA (N(6)-L-threonylcarbamoyladenosine(37)-C(2))-methylthiotransferase MtaB [Chloroflexota bacterium]
MRGRNNFIAWRLFPLLTLTPQLVLYFGVPIMERNTRMPKPRVAIETLGCKVNQADSEAVLRQFVDLDYQVVAPSEPADVYVVNTCTVTHVADRKSRQLIRQMRRRGAEPIVAVIGCFVETAGEALERLDGVDLIVVARQRGDVARLAEELRRERLGSGSSTEVGDGEPSAVEGSLDVVTGLEAVNERTRAFVNAQEGCADFCTYCIVPTARGRPRSVPAEQVISRVAELAAEGRKEIVLTGVNLGTYGREPGATADNPSLAGLVRRILAETPIPRLRLSSIEPHHLDDEVIALLQSDRICRHLHLPLQSGSDSVLRRMGRRYTTAQFAALVEAIRAISPLAAITTDLIVGFPGETGDEFREGYAYLEALDPAGIHVFKYSPRAGTPATRLPDQVSEHVKKARSERVLRLAEECRARFYGRNLGQSLDVLYEFAETAAGGEHRWIGLTDNYVRVSVADQGDLHNRILSTHLTECEGPCVSGEVEA